MICISTTSEEYRFNCTVGWQSTSLSHAVISPIIPIIRGVKTCAILSTLPVKCASVVPRCSTHRQQRKPLTIVSGFTFSALGRVASELYKTLLGESRRPVLLSGVEVPGSKCLNNAVSRLNELQQTGGRCYA